MILTDALDAASEFAILDSMNLTIVKIIEFLSVSALALTGQNVATLTVRVTDPATNVVESVEIQLSHPLSGFSRTARTDAQGQATLTNIPFNDYQLRALKDGFAPLDKTKSLRTSVPQFLDLQLTLPSSSSVIEVRDDDGRRLLVDPAETGSRHQMNQADIERLATNVSTRGLESVLATFPGFAQNANGAIHPRGAHNQMTFVIDGMPISDQLTGAFANAVDPNIVQTVELFTGNIPAEFGNKVSAVAQITTKTGLGLAQPFTGSLLLSGAEPFDTASTVAQAAGELLRNKLGYSASLSAMKTNRYLDSVSLDNLNNGGDSQRAFVRVDYHATPRDILRANVMSGRSQFDLANLRSQHANGMDASQRLTDQSASLAWVRTLSPSAIYESNLSWRTSSAFLNPSPGDTPVTAWQDRRLSTYTAWNRVSVTRGAHQLRAGIDLQRFPVRERFTFNDTFRFDQAGTGGLYTGFIQDRVRWQRFQFSLGLRYDVYRFLSRGNQLQPRVGVSYELIPGRTVLRASYNRTYQTPPNENLLLSNTPGALAIARGGLAIIPPERQNFYEAGLQQSIGSKLSLTASYYHKDARDQQDNNSFFETGIIFPTSLARIRVNGAEGRIAVTPLRNRAGNWSGSVSFTHARAISTPPFTGGLFLGQEALNILSAGPFVIDHDQKLAVHGILTWSRRGWFSTASVRYDSGLVANPSDPAEVAADPDYADLLPYVNLTSNPARTRPRTITDLVFGYERSLDAKKRWEASVQVTNLTNQTALYNFQSIFVGTRLVQPRSAGLRLRWFF